MSTIKTNHSLITTSTILLLLLLIIILTTNTGLVYASEVSCGSFGASNMINCSVEIDEQVPDNTLVFNPINYFTNSGGFQVIVYTAVGTNSNRYGTHFMEDSNVLYTKGSFDRETMVDRSTSPFPVTFEVNILSYTLNHQQSIQLIINVMDRNDNVPRFRKNQVFLGPSLQLQRFESPNIDTILTVEPVDYDQGDNGTSHVELVQPDPPMFNLSIIYDGSHPTTVYVIPLDPLDREFRDTYNFQLIAYEGVTNPANATLNVTLTVQDINDNLPTFNETEYVTSISESSPIDTPLIHIHANDPDEGTNAAISYSIQDVCAKKTASGSCLDISEPWPFVLDTESGLLQIREMLNYEEVVQYRLTIDASNPNELQGGSSTALVNVLVVDVNDKPPEVTNFVAAPSLSESSLVNSTYATFKVRDNDSDAFSHFRLSLLDNITLTNSSTFGLRNTSSTSFSIVLLTSLDRESQNNYSLYILAQDLLNSSLYTTYNFTILVSDFNDHPPIFDPVDNPLLFEEESPPGTTVIHLSTTDRDTGSNAAVRYSLPPTSNNWPYQGNFTIQPATGRILVGVSLDRETTPTLSILVRARDQNGTGLTTNLILNITLTDINDNAPLITTVIPNQINVSESVNINTLIIDIDASDADIGSNADISYSLTLLSPALVNSPLVIHQSTGRVTVNDTLDYETTVQYTYRVSVTDGVNTPTQRDFILNVVDVNDNSPTFSNNNYYRTLHENASINTPVITMVAQDADSALITNLTYHLISGSSHFHLNSLTGVVTTVSPLDWETQSEYTLVIRANDGYGRNSLTNANLIITVIDINDEIPRFIGVPYMFSVNEGTGANELVGHVTVHSHEVGPNGAPLFYIDTNNVPFSINGSGHIITTSNLNREETDSYQITVRVEDVAPPPHYNTTVVTVTVADINDNPPVFSTNLVSLSISEIQAVNSPFYTAQAIDADIYPNNITRYTLNPTVQGFQIDPSTGDLSLTTSLNYEVQQNILLTIRGEDQGNPSVYFTTQQVNITVLDDNNTNITFPANFPLFYDLPENAPLDFVLLNFTGEDHKGNPRLHLSYYLTDQTGTTPTEFGLERESSTGYAILTVTDTLDRETNGVYILNITIIDDNTSPQSTVTQYLTVNLLDVNDNSPSFSSLSYTFTIQEEIQGRHEIDTVLANDPDNGTNGTVMYSLQNTMNGLFYINPNTGVLYQERSLDRETEDTYTLTVIASDGGNPSRTNTTTVVVMVTDINDNAPTFTPSRVQVEENLNVGTIITTLVGHDNDIGINGEVTFTYTQGSNATSHFQLLPNGTIRVIQVPDYEQQTTFIFYIEVQDTGEPPLQSTGNITIHVTDLNDNCPQFISPLSQYNISVLENTTVGSLLLNVTAIDLDQGAAGVVKYTFENIADSHQFDIDSYTGELTLAASLDYETTPLHKVGILAYDQGLPRNQICQQTLYISVENVNEFSPYFDTPLYVFSVNEEEPSGTTINTVKGYDEDSNSVLTYSLIESSQVIEINPSTGELRTLVTLDYEMTPLYNISIQVSDQGGKTGQATVLVLVNNINDHNPIFPLNTYTASISEMAVQGTPVLTVIATDNDNNTNSAVTYNIIGGNIDGVFDVNKYTGQVYVNGTLNYESITDYALTIRATDTGIPPRTGSANVLITVINYNEFSPIFSSPNYTFNVSENVPIGTTVGRVNATDLDSGNYGNIKYYLTSSLFTIDHTTGIIETKSVIDRETTPTLHPLTVTASDSYRNTTVNVTILILDANDNRPMFEENLYEFSVNISSPINTNIGTVVAMDMDLIPVTYYSIINPPQNLPFSIGNTTGTLQVSNTLISVNTPYQFTVQSTDSGNSSYTDTTTVRVYIVSFNDHYPNFTQSLYTVTIEENDLPAQPIITTVAQDPDTGSNGVVKYSLTPSGDLTKDQFSIDQLSGDLSLTQSLDYEHMTTHDIIVYARDSSPSPRTATTHVLITVTNVNDNSPMFVNFTSPLYLSYVPYIGLELFQLKGQDRDGQNVSFQIYTQTNKFTIDANTGIVRNIIILNETVTYSIVFRITDGNLTSTQTMSFNIVSPVLSLTPSLPNDSPTYSVSETAAINRLITTFTALNNPTSYHIVCCGIDLLFTINKQTGALTVSSQLNYESITSYQLIIEARKIATNGTRYSNYQHVTINVTNVNEYTPIFTQVNTPITISEGTSSGSLVTQVTAQDSDTGIYGDITYDIISGNIQDTFSIGETNGAIVIATGKTLDRESVSQYTLTIRARDGGGLFSVAMVTIMIQDENDSPPTFPGNYTISVYEPGEINDMVIRVNAIDLDIDSNLRYQLGSVNSYLDDINKGVTNNIFSINSTNGVITLSGLLDYETADRYEFIVMVTDTLHTDTSHVIIHVLDVNDNTPSIQSSNNNVFIPELSPQGADVVRMTATDSDSFRNGMIRYTLGNDWPVNKFVIDTYGGTVYVREPMNASELASDCNGPFRFTATVYVSDGVYNSSTTVTVNLRDINKYAPIFIDSPYNIIVSETTPIGTSLIPEGLYITDPDCGLNSYYTTTFPSYYFQPTSLFSFNLVSNGQYEIVTKKTLPQGVYHFRLQAHNNRPFPLRVNYYKASYSHVTVTVLPNNSHAPSFNTLGPFSVYENSEVNTEVGIIIATDLDLGVSGEVTYTLNDTMGTPFVINGSTGRITVNGSLDYETQQYYALHIIATDSGYPVKNTNTLIHVHVLDVDDNPPIFVSTLFSGTIRENSPLNTTVLILNVTDADSIISVQYSIENSTVGLPFSLHPLTGVLSTSGSIDYETHTEYLLRVSSKSLTNSDMSSLAWVLITVESVNEFSPILPNLEQPIEVPLGLPKGGVVTTIVAMDADKGKDGEITYLFSPSTTYLKPYSNGTVILNISLNDIMYPTVTSENNEERKRDSDNNTNITIQLTVVAMDTGTPPKNDTGHVTIVIPERAISASPISPTETSLTIEVIAIMSSVAGTLVLIILMVLFLTTCVYIRSHRLKKSKLDLRNTGTTSPQITEIPREEEDSGGVELRQINSRSNGTNSVTPTKTVSRSNSHLNKAEIDESERQRRHSPHTRSTSDLASSIATDTLNLTQETNFPYTKGQIEAIYAANVDLLHDGSQASVHTFGSEGGGESDGDEFDNLYYTKYSEIDAEGSLIGADDDLSSLGKPGDRNSISESSDGLRDEEYHFSQSTNPWSSRRSINDLMAEHSSALLYSFTHSQGPPPHFGTSTQGSNTSLLRSQRPNHHHHHNPQHGHTHHSQYRYGSERNIPQHVSSSSQPHHHINHRVPHPPNNYEYYPHHGDRETPPIPSTLLNPSRNTASPRHYDIIDYRHSGNIPRGPPPPPYFTQDPVPRNLTQGSSRGSRGENYYSPEPLQFHERQTLSSSSTSLSTSASHPYRGGRNGY